MDMSEPKPIAEFLQYCVAQIQVINTRMARCESSLRALNVNHSKLPLSTKHTESPNQQEKQVQTTLKRAREPPSSPTRDFLVPSMISPPSSSESEVSKCDSTPSNAKRIHLCTTENTTPESWADSCLVA
eukprot:c1043_g1_i1.p1 GENE.c1043_g1_i1~~c1043_g1_i1.p1  ORF type:complete len:143 (+),score=18.75 c1043_g1_i1:45-431(+)